jgi:hypothetical protein
MVVDRALRERWLANADGQLYPLVVVLGEEQTLGP